MTKARALRSKIRRMCQPQWRAAALLAMLFAWDGTGRVAAQTPRESDVEAAYIFNFAKFMHTPAHNPDIFTIAVVGKSPIGQTLDTLTANEQIDGRALKVVHAETVDQARNSDIVFLSESEMPRMDRDLAALTDSNALTVSNTNEFAQHGGMIQFVVLDNRVRFTVNLKATNKAKIILSSQLLKVAMSVDGTANSEAQP